jgi:hypothetical protein
MKSVRQWFLSQRVCIESTRVNSISHVCTLTCLSCICASTQQAMSERSCKHTDAQLAGSAIYARFWGCKNTTKSPCAYVSTYNWQIHSCDVKYRRHPWKKRLPTRAWVQDVYAYILAWESETSANVCIFWGCNSVCIVPLRFCIHEQLMI